MSAASLLAELRASLDLGNTHDIVKHLRLLADSLENALDGSLSVTGTLDMDGNSVMMGGGNVNMEQGDLLNAGSVEIESSFPILYQIDTDAAADEGVWGRYVNASGTLIFATFTGAKVFGASAIQVRRTGTTVDQIDLFADLDINGNSIVMSSATGVYVGSGSPESAVTANVGSIFLRTDGGASTSLYVKESGTGNTGWVAK